MTLCIQLEPYFRTVYFTFLDRIQSGFWCVSFKNPTVLDLRENKISKIMPRGKFPEIYTEIFDENYNMRPCKEVKCRKYGGYLVSLNYDQFYESVFAHK